MARTFWRITRSFIASLAAAHFACAPAAAQVYPTRPVTIVVPFAAGGANDILARLIAPHMGQALRPPFVLENRRGAGGGPRGPRGPQGPRGRLYAEGRPFRRVRLRPA